MPPRRDELATLAAAHAPHATMAVAGDGDGLTESAVMALAEQVVDDAGAVAEGDVARLRELGVAPDARYGALDPELREVLVVGRPIAGA